MASLDTIGGNDKAAKIAKALGYSSAEELKEDFVPKGEVKLYDIKYDKKTKELVLVNKITNKERRTNLKLPMTSW